MKKFLSILLVVMVLNTLLIPVEATQTTREVIATYEDGSYLVREITITTVNSVTWSSTLTKEATNTTTYYNSNDVEQWNYYLHAKFLYREGGSVICQYKNDGYNIIKSGWSLGSHECWTENAVAYGTVTMEYKVLGITVNTITDTLSIACDNSGNITYG